MSMPPSHKHLGTIARTQDVSINVEQNSENVTSLKKEGKTKLLSASIGSAVFYGVCSSSMAFINKAVVTAYRFNFPFFIMMCQMIATIGFLEFIRMMGFVKLTPYSIEKGRQFFWPTMFYALHSITALNALGGMTIPMYAAIKRCSPLVTLILSIVILNKRWPSYQVLLSIGFITVGCVIAGIGDLSFDMWAYIYGLISVVAQGLYLTLVQRGVENNMSTLEILQLNSFNTVPFFAFIWLISQEFHQVIYFRGITNLDFLACLIAQICIGSVLNYSLFLCTALNSALTTSLVGVLKSVVQTVVGFITFGGVKFHPLNITGLVLNTCGGFIYTYEKYKETTRSDTTEKKEERETLNKSHISNGIHFQLPIDRGSKTCL